MKTDEIIIHNVEMTYSISNVSSNISDNIHSVILFHRIIKLNENDVIKERRSDDLNDFNNYDMFDEKKFTINRRLKSFKALQFVITLKTLILRLLQLRIQANLQ